jgi:hypothetical protein
MHVVHDTSYDTPIVSSLTIYVTPTMSSLIDYSATSAMPLMIYHVKRQTLGDALVSKKSRNF